MLSRKLVFRTMAIMIVAVTFTGASFAAAPNLLNYQGRLTDASGNPVADGIYRVEFNIYSTDSGGVALWSELQSVTVTSGLFAVLLGTDTPLSPSLFSDSVRYLGIRIDSDPEISPRTRIASVAYALATADGGGGNGWQDDGASVHTVTSTDFVGIGTSTPSHALHVVEPNDGLFVSRFQSGNPLATVSILANTSASSTWETAISGSNMAFGQIPPASMYYYLQGSARPNMVMKASGRNVMGAFNAPTQATLYVVDSSTSGNAIVGVAANLSAGALTGISGIVGPNPSNEPRFSRAVAGSAGTFGTGGLFSGRIGVSATGSNTDDTYAYGLQAEAFQGGSGQAFAVSGKVLSGSGTNHGFYSEVSGTGDCFGLRTHVYGSGTNYGVYAEAASGTSNKAGQFFGDVNIQGNLFKSSGAFRIDHPLDPENKYLQHSFVESPDMKNMYDGVVVLGRDGKATVELQNWFGVLNMDFRYQLTCIGGHAPVFIESEIESNRFVIAGGRPGLKVSWQVTGTRKDAYAESNRLQVEVDKRSEERGKFVHPELYGGSKESAIGYIAPNRDANSNQAELNRESDKK